MLARTPGNSFIIYLAPFFFPYLVLQVFQVGPEEVHLLYLLLDQAHPIISLRFCSNQRFQLKRTNNQGYETSS
jgi:hypothetical protein